MNQYIELARKLDALAKSGVGGEKVNAKRHLDRLMRKHNITQADLELETVQWVEFTVKRALLQLFYQVAISVTGSNRKVVAFRNRPTRLKLEITKLEEIDLRARWEFFQRAYLRQQKVFFYAFITKNQLFDPNQKPIEMDKLSKEEIADIRDALVMTDKIKASPFFDAIQQTV